jgi:hypothetical protein
MSSRGGRVRDGPQECKSRRTFGKASGGLIAGHGKASAKPPGQKERGLMAAQFCTGRTPRTSGAGAAP